MLRLLLAQIRFLPTALAMVWRRLALAYLVLLIVCVVAGFDWSIVLAIFAVVTLAVFRQWFALLFSFSAATRSFRKVKAGRVILRYDPLLEGALDVSAEIRRWEAAVDALAPTFGRTLRRPLLVVFFATVAPIARLARIEFAAAAWPGGDIVIVGADSLRAYSQPDELARHEVAHLLSASWGTIDPPLKGEGLATLMQGSHQEEPLDFRALTLLLADQCMPTPWFRSRAAFYPGRQWSYLLAGSFTGYLVRRYGWEAYRRFYHRARDNNFERVFQQTYRTGLLEAEREWRRELLAKEPEYPSLGVAVRRARVLAAGRLLQLYPCVRETEALVAAGEANGVVLWAASGAYTLLGEYERAAALLEQAMKVAQEARGDDASLYVYRSAAYMRLGQLRSLLGQREESMLAYESALAAPDWWSAETGSIHQSVRRLLNRQRRGHGCSETELLAPLKKRLRAEWRRLA